MTDNRYTPSGLPILSLDVLTQSIREESRRYNSDKIPSEEYFRNWPLYQETVQQLVEDGQENLASMLETGMLATASVQNSNTESFNFLKAFRLVYFSLNRQAEVNQFEEE